MKKLLIAGYQKLPLSDQPGWVPEEPEEPRLANPILSTSKAAESFQNLVSYPEALPASSLPYPHQHDLVCKFQPFSCPRPSKPPALQKKITDSPQLAHSPWRWWKLLDCMRISKCIRKSGWDMWGSGEICDERVGYVSMVEDCVGCVSMLEAAYLVKYG